MGPCHNCAPDCSPGRGLGMHHPREGWKRTSRCSRRSPCLMNCSTVAQALGHTLPHCLASDSPLGTSSAEQGSAHSPFQLASQWEWTCISLPAVILQWHLWGRKNLMLWACAHTLERTSLSGDPFPSGRPNSLRTVYAQQTGTLVSLGYNF